MLTRRSMLIAAGAQALALRCAQAQQGRKVWRLGFLTPSLPYRPGEPNIYGQAFAQALQAQGFAYGVDYTAESRSAEGDPSRLPSLAAELAKSVDILLPITNGAALAAQKATSTLPIVFLGVHDPVGGGLVASLAKPGANLTGLASFHGELIPKHIELLRAIAPRAKRVSILSPEIPARYGDVAKRAQAAATTNGMQLQFLDTVTEDTIERTFATMARERVDAFVAASDAHHLALRQRIAELALRQRLPSLFALRENVEAGGLMSYGESSTGLFGHAAKYVARIFKGAKPGDLPVEQPTVFHLAINRSTAKALGIAIPQDLLLRADELID